MAIKWTENIVKNRFRILVRKRCDRPGQKEEYEEVYMDDTELFKLLESRDIKKSYLFNRLYYGWWSFVDDSDYSLLNLPIPNTIEWFDYFRIEYDLSLLNKIKKGL